MSDHPDRGRDVLDMGYINSLPAPFIGRMLGGWEWPIHDFEVETGLLRVDVCGMLQAMSIGEFTSFRDDAGRVHSVEGFYSDAIPEERIASTPDFFARHPRITLLILALVYTVIDHLGDFQP